MAKQIKTPKYLLEDIMIKKYSSKVKDYTDVSCPNCNDTVMVYPGSSTNCPSCGYTVTLEKP